MSQTRQESQQPTNELPSEPRSDETYSFVISCKDEDLIFSHGPDHAQISRAEFKSLISEVFLSDSRQTSEGVSYDHPECDGTHTQSELALMRHVDSGAISFERRPKVNVLSMLMFRTLAFSMLASMLDDSDSSRESKQGVGEDPKAESREEPKVDAQPSAPSGDLSSLGSETPAGEQGRTSVV